MAVALLLGMSAIVPCTSAICAALLVALLPATADAAGTLAPVPVAGWQRPWPALAKLQLTPLRNVSELDSLPSLTAPRLALALEPDLATTWTTQAAAVPLKLELDHRSASKQGSASSDRLLGLNLPAEVPPLIRYSDEDTHVTLSISPGSPCTGACLKLAGSF